MMILSSFLLECSQEPLVRNKDDFRLRQPHLQEHFHHPRSPQIPIKYEYLTFSTFYTSEMWLFLHPTPYLEMDLVTPL